MNAWTRAGGLLLIPTTLAGAVLFSQPEDGGPVNTPFTDAKTLTSPPGQTKFHFAVIGDRTGGPEEGIDVLDEAVHEINRLDPDFVMTVGDLINGYNKEDRWLAQMEEYHDVMGQLNMPWYPVAGNHDVYGDRGSSTDRSNEVRYQEHFGPLYYSFDYKFAHFVVLYSDEQLSYKNPPVDQRMSDAQLEWLRQDLAATDAIHTFVFIHHPRWNYPGDIWAPVHEVLAADGNVRAVFAGHWHRYRSDGERDGIRYYMMAATGASIGSLDQIGQFHHYNFVSVRLDGWTMGCLPVGSVLGADFVTGAESDECLSLRKGDWLTLNKALPAAVGEPVDSRIGAVLQNDTDRDIEYRLDWSTSLDEYTFEPVTRTVTVSAGGEATVEFQVTGRPRESGLPLRRPTLAAVANYPLRSGRVQPLETVMTAAIEHPQIPDHLPLETPPDEGDRVLELDGSRGVVVVEHDPALDPEGPFTLECWVRPTEIRGRTGLVNRTEMSSYGFFLHGNAGEGPSFSVFIAGEGYATAEAVADSIRPGEWVHVAGTFDGTDTRLYLNGKLAAAARHEGALGGNSLPLMIGADVGRSGQANSHLTGQIDEVRLSRGVRYADDFEPATRFTPDDDTLLLLHMDHLFGSLTPDTSGNGFHGELRGTARLAIPDSHPGDRDE